ncbi:hypothetical protein [Eggerthella guodeyinii]|uniref:Leucine-rich repeat domain-containing protein n=1 Tax=Eggerthella guodeyinii TaxID=2690837 RepID=A0A6N7RNV5_9ACTN|nr:hypothetical protein [Eggerthella guodeyinii]MRX83033.1 hypothetical protein [Eggerthella guodeyinii]
MTKPALHSIALRKAAPLTGAAFALCLLLVFGLLWPVPVSFAAEEVESPTSEAPVDSVDNVVVETPVPSEPAAKPEPQPQPDSQPDSQPEPTVPETSVAPEPEYENAWAIGAEEASSVVAQLWDDGTFVVDGAGETVAFDDVEDVPWLAAGVADDIERVIFADKVEASSLAHWFEGCSNLREVANVPADVEDMTRAFYDCPKLVELPDEFAFADEVVAEACFGFEEPAETLLTTAYRGADENVLAYAWELDGRELVNPDAPEPPVTEKPQDPAEPTGPTEPVESETPEDAENAEDPNASKDPDAPADEPAEQPVDERADELANAPAEETPAPDEAPEPEPEPAPAPQEEAQVNITVPSSVAMMLNAEGDNTALIPVAAANRSERSVAIVGARLKRASQDLPGGSWSLTTESGSTTFVEDARFTPLGLEVTFDRPVILAAGDESTMLVWHGTFTDYGMKQLVGAAVDAGDEGFAYGSMIWIVAAA